MARAAGASAGRALASGATAEEAAAAGKREVDEAQRMKEEAAALMREAKRQHIANVRSFRHEQCPL